MPSSPASLDPTSLTQLREVVGDDFTSLLAKYLDTAETLLASLRDAWGKKDMVGTIHAAHALRSPSHQIGALALKDALAAIEWRARKDEWPLPDALLDDVEAQFLAVKSALAEIMQAPR